MGDVSAFLKALVADVPETMKADAQKYGYWPITQALVRDYLPANRNKTKETVGSADGLSDSIYLGGHSQGGARAAFVSAWLEKEDGMKYDTTPFASASGQCVARGHTVQGNDRSPFMDLGVSHPQITEYVDIFDVYGHFDYNIAGRAANPTIFLREAGCILLSPL